MIPLRLTIKGINSYRQEHVIDFSHLLESQLFGIFGPVGSGKSTILEAMALAIYGDTDRLNRSGDNRNYNLMNLQSDEMMVDFEFSAGDTDRKYRCVYSAKRSKKYFERVTPPEHKAYCLEGAAWVPVALEDIERAIGLNYRNFKRAVIIPQGKFQEFLQLGAADRTKMMQDIFGLEKFDLGAKAKGLKQKNDLNIKELEGALSQFEQITEDVLVHEEALKTQLEQKLDLQSRKLTVYENAGVEVKKLEALKVRTGKVEATLSSNRKELTERNEAIVKFNEQFADLEKAYEQLGQLKEEREGLMRLLEAKSTEQEIRRITARMEEHKRVATEVTESIGRGRKMIEGVDRELDEMRSQRKNLKLLTMLDGWFKDLDSLQQRRVNSEAQVRSLEVEAVAKLENAIIAYPSNESKPNGFQEGIQLVKQEKQKLESTLAKIREEEQQLAVSRQISDWAGQLKEDEPCPLCGSTHHPEIHSLENTAQKSLQLSERKAGLTAQLRQIQDFEEKWIYWEAEYSSLMRQKESKINDLKACRKEEDAFTTSFPKSHYELKDQEKVRLDLATCLELEEKINLLTEERHRKATALEALIKRSERIAEEAQAIDREHAALLSKKATLEQLSNALLLDKYQEETPAELSKIVEKSTMRISYIEENFKEQQQRQQSMLRLRDQLDGEIKVNEQYRVELRKEQEEAIESLRQIVANSEEPWLQSWFESSSYPSFANKFSALKKEVEQGKESYLNQKNKLERLMENLQTKKEIAGKLRKLQDREENIQVLLRLFKGNGFVEYISSIYLQELCEAANERFYRLTRQRLRLEMNEKNQFIIRDLLNQGKIRSAKTLSGGQLFQAALSLALALAENVRKQNGFSQQFFFIDEGFGTQDEESLQLVINTLKSLRKEGRMVGVISHLEALQEEIDLYLSISNDEFEGSIVKESWRA